MTGLSAVELLALLPLFFWALLAFDRSRAWPRELFLPTGEPDVSEGEEESVVAVVPARDEADLLTLSLPSLLAQAGPRFSVVLVDDGSTDETVEVAHRLARRLGAGDRFRIVEASPTPPGWTGKVHALACGVAAANERVPPTWFLFTDADIRHRRGSVGALLQQARSPDGPYDLVSVMARLRADSGWERLLIPAFVFFFHLLYPFRRVRRAGSGVAAAAGGCILVRREALESAGGLAAFRGAVIDDLALARRVSRANGRLWLGFDPGTVSVRPYRDLGAIWRMVSRSAFVQLRRSWALLALVLTVLLALVVSPPLLAGWAALGLAGRTADTGVHLRVLVVSLSAWALEARALWPYVRHHHLRAVWALALPLAALLYAAMTASSALDHLRGRGARWKGRSYPS